MTPHRTFEASPAVRTAMPLLVGLIGPSGSGKTYSALRLATGVQAVTGGDVYMIDTESRRGLHYADRFRYHHVPFGAPFGPLDYLAAIRYCAGKGAAIVIVDSMSHEHEGPGGVLEMHEAETQRMAADYKCSEGAVTMGAWNRPKRERREMITGILQLEGPGGKAISFVFCFRAKPKLKLVRGKDPIELGFMPQAGEEFIYELTAKCLLLPGACGTPTWQSKMPGERMMTKRPEQFLDVLTDGRRLDEAVGREMATWAAGIPSFDAAAFAARYSTASPAGFAALETERRAVWGTLGREARAALKAAADAAKARIGVREPGEEG